MSGDDRPDSDTLLDFVRRQEQAEHRGRLKIFFGSSAGVGKTYAMLGEAQRRAMEGVRVLVGYAEPHIRPETEALLLGLDILPYLMVDYRGTRLKEFDLDAALKLKPELILIDELAHTNAPGMRHAKRWQDVAELLAADIDVYATLNVQHLESVNDLVEQATGVRVQETLPDSVFEQADEVQLVDVAPEQLLERLREGKIYRGSRAEAALENFFSIGNLLSLRELAMRRTAERIDRDLDSLRVVNRQKGEGTVSEKILVCVGPSPSSGNLVRAAARMARAMKVDWIAAFVETPTMAHENSATRRQAEAHLKMAEQLGGKTVILSGFNAAREIVAYAKSRNVARIIAGKPATHGWRRWLLPSLVSGLIRGSDTISLSLVKVDFAAPNFKTEKPPRNKSTTGIFAAVLVVAAITAVGIFLYHVLGISNINVLMLYLLGVIWLSARFGKAAGATACLLGVAAFDFTVVPPYYSFAVSDTQYILTFAAMLTVGLTISTVTTRLKEQEKLARMRQTRATDLLEMSSAISGSQDLPTLAQAVLMQIESHFKAQSVLFLPDQSGKPVILDKSPNLQPDDKECAVAAWVLRNGKPAGVTTDTLPSARGIYLPLNGVRHVIGVLGIFPPQPADMAASQHMATLDAFSVQLAVALERITLAAESQKAWAQAQNQAMRNTLLSAVSHDLRTPLAAITGAATSMVQGDAALSPAQIRELAQMIADESNRMEKLIRKLLEMTRLEAGRIELRRELFPLEEVIESARAQMAPQHQNRFHVSTMGELPPFVGDPELLGQVMTNLFENAIEHSGSDQPVEVRLFRGQSTLIITVRDHGTGVKEEDRPHLFEKFFRSHQGVPGGGLGLGLAICRAIVELHGGAISVRNHPDGGAEFRLELPLAQKAPGQPAQRDGANSAPAHEAG